MSTDSSTGLTTLRTLDDKITLDATLAEKHDMFQRLTYSKKRFDFLVYLHERNAEIEAVVSYYLGLNGKGNCYLALINDWIHGSFNMCLPVYVKNWKIIRKSES